MSDYMYLTVTEKDIREGKRWDCESCPFALAAMRKFSAPYVSVEGFSLTFEVAREVFRYRLGLPAYKWIANFDNGEAVSPGRFRIEFRGSVLR